MTINGKIGDRKLRYDVNKGAAKYHHHHLEMLIKMNILQVIKYYHLMKED